jgi:hypothetical protein
MMAFHALFEKSLGNTIFFGMMILLELDTQIYEYLFFFKMIFISLKTGKRYILEGITKKGTFK